MKDLRYRIVKIVDQWAHYHRFEWRCVCDYFERLNGCPKEVLRSERKSRLVHNVSRSYFDHPSQGQRVS